ncbi:HEAT repeat domain-containing protein [Candidatus Poribacteria bacterium]
MKKYLLPLLIMLLLYPLSAVALGGRNPSFSDVMADTELIVRGTVLAVHKGEEDMVEVKKRRSPVIIDGNPRWFVRWPAYRMWADFTVEKVLKGNLASSNIRIEYWEDNRKTVFGIAGLLFLARGESCYLFLKRTDKENVFRPATLFATSKQSLSRRVGRPFVFKGEHPWRETAPTVSNETVDAFQEEYAEALKAKDPTEFSFEIMRAMSVTVTAFSLDRSYLAFLTKALKNDPSALVRQHSALVLQDFATTTTVKALVRALQKDADAAVRLRALKSLKLIIRRTKRADIMEYVTYVRDALLNDPDEKVRLEAVEDIMAPAAIYALKKRMRDVGIVQAHRKALNDTSPQVVLKASVALENMTGDPVLPELVKLLKENRSDPDIPNPVYSIFVIARAQYESGLEKEDALRLIGMTLAASTTPWLAHAAAEFYKEHGFRDETYLACALGVRLQAGEIIDADDLELIQSIYAEMERYEELVEILQDQKQHKHDESWLQERINESRRFATDLYVAVHGSDQNPGTRSRPFATIQRARDAVRQIKETATEPITVHVRGGTYYLSEPVVFTPEDSGTEDVPITYAAYKGEKAKIRGSVKLDLQWSEYRDGIMQAEIPAVKQDKLSFLQLSVAGRRQRPARYPNYDHDYPRLTDISPDHDALAPERVRRWADPVGGVVHGLSRNKRGSLHYRIVGVDESGELRLEGGHQTNRESRLHHQYRYVENIFEELDAPLEWYLDEERGILYYMPPTIELNDAKVEAVLLRQLFEFRGSMDKPVKHITIRGFQMTQTEHTFLEEYEGLLRGDWAIHRSGAVFMEGAEDCAIEDCFFYWIGGNGVFISNYNRRVRVSGCEFGTVADNAICLVGSVRAVRSPSTWSQHVKNPDRTVGPANLDYPARCLIHNNRIRSIGTIGKQTAGVFISMAAEITVSHNAIYDVQGTGICINDGCWGGHIIEYNDVFNTARETVDHGPFESQGRDRHWGIEDADLRKSLSRLDSHKTTVIRKNRFQHYGSQSWVIDLGEGSSNYLVYGNLCLGASIRLQEGYYRSVENNVIVSPVPLSLHNWYPDSMNIITRNIIAVTGNEVYKPMEMPEHPWGRIVDRNLFVTSDMGKFLVKGTANSLEEWHELGYDSRSIQSSPLFIDPDNGDYRVKPDSPALKLGFRNVPMDRFGATRPEFRESAERASSAYQWRHEFMSAPEQEDQPAKWLGAEIRTLISAEGSPSGLFGEAGVVLISMPEDSQASQAGFQQDDVILALGSEPVDNVHHLLTSQKKIKFGEVDVTIHRGEQKLTVTLHSQ